MGERECHARRSELGDNGFAAAGGCRCYSRDARAHSPYLGYGEMRISIAARSRECDGPLAYAWAARMVFIRTTRSMPILIYIIFSMKK